jgi:tetratricopeptide (TPR) repeat protein
MTRPLGFYPRLDYSRMRDPLLMFYTRAVAEYQNGDGDSAIRSLERGLRENPDDELSRLLLEEIILYLYADDLEHPLRSGYAGYNFSLAGEYMQRNRFDSAAYHLRRGLTLAPFSEEGRRLYAELLRERGEYSRYVQALDFLSSQLMIADQSIADDLEIYRDILRDSVPRDWGIDQFVLERSLLRLGVYIVDGSSPSVHGGGRPHRRQASYGSAVREQPGILRHAPGLDELSYDVAGVSNAAQAFEYARRSDAEYYLVFVLVREMSPLSLKPICTWAEPGGSFAASP